MTPDQYTLVLNFPGWAVVVAVMIASITVPLNLYRCVLEIRKARLDRQIIELEHDIATTTQEGE